MRRFLIACAVFFALTAPALSGVVIEMQVTDVDGGGPSATDTIYSSGKMLRVDPHKSRDNGDASMIFRNDAMTLIDHEEKSCQTIDKAGLDELSAQLGGAMKQLEDALANVPAAQREMMENMLKDQMPAGFGGEAEPRRIETGETTKVGDYTCTTHTLYSGDRRVWEVCAADQDDIDGFSELMQGFTALSEFTAGLREMAAQTAFANMIETPFADIESVGGIPVRVRNYSDGELESESTLQSISRRDVDAAMFEPPQGYKVTKLADELTRRR